MTSTHELLLGVDGGGTKTVAWLGRIDDPQAIVGRGAAGPGNVRAVGFAATQANIEAAIDAVFRDAGLDRTTVAAACLGLAGAGRPEEQQQMTAWASERKIAGTVRVTSDAEPILAAASPENCGIALICGTGSLAWGRSVAGETARAGGWGYLLGDEGSAYWIARRGLQAATRAADGRGRATALLVAFLEKLDAAQPQQLIERVYDAAMTRDRLAELAGVVFQAAEHDEVAAEILTDGARELAACVAAVSRRLSLASYPLAVTGGVVLNREAYRQQVLAHLAEQNASPSSVVLVSEPVRGALELARRMLH